MVSTAGAALLYPRLGRSVLGGWAASILIDADHYVWYVVRERRMNPVSAVRFFSEARPPHHRSTRVLHSPAVLLTMLLLGARYPKALPLAIGMSAHAALDLLHESRMDSARTKALQRDEYTCQTCGETTRGVDAHLRRQPWLLPSYRPQNLIALCSACHDAEHARGNHQP
jgi:hypothetical protein